MTLTPPSTQTENQSTTAIMLDETKRWLKQFVLEHNLCPFAHKDYAQNKIHYTCMSEHDDNAYYDSVVAEVERLFNTAEISTTLLLWPELREFNDFLSVVGMAEQILISHGWQHDFQLAHFHPDYCFTDTDEDDLANYTNRSPYPMLHILRVEQMAQVLARYPEPEQIPERNIAHVRQLGLAYLQALLTGLSHKT